MSWGPILRDYMDTKPSSRMVRTQKEVLDSLVVGAWKLKEADSEYLLVHYHPRFGECSRQVPVKLVSRMIERDLLDYEDPNSNENPYLVPGCRVFVDKSRNTWGK